MTDPQTPATEAGRRYLNRVAPITTQSLGAANDAEWSVRQSHADAILAIEAEGRASLDVDDVLGNLESYARSHAAFTAGRGNVDDVLGFIAWYRATLAETEP